jgi:O-antigen/teichoic acid export membrane protein
LSSIEARTVRGISAIGVSQLGTLVSGVAVVVVLARILGPEEFGIVGVAIIIINLLMSIQEFGIIPAVVQRDSRIEESVSAGFALRLIAASLIAVGIVAVSPIVSQLVNDHRIALVMVALAPNLFVLSLGFPSQALLMRSLRFSALAVANLCQFASLAVTSIVMALLGFSYWSLVLGFFLSSVIYVCALRYFEKGSFNLTIDVELMKELLGFGKHLLIVALMVFIILNVDQLIVANVLGLTVLGFYVIAVRFGRTLGEQISGTMNKVLFPTMARIKAEPQLLKTIYLQSLRMLSILIVPLAMGISALSPLFLEVVLGNEWNAAALPLSIIAIEGLFCTLVAPSSNILLSMGKPRYLSILSSVQAVSVIIGVPPMAILFGISGVCIFKVVLSIGALAYYFTIFSGLFKARLREVVTPIVPSLTSGAMLFFFLLMLSGFLPTGFLSLIGLAVAGGVVYLSSLHFLSRGRDVREFLRVLKMLVMPGRSPS